MLQNLLHTRVKGYVKTIHLFLVSQVIIIFDTFICSFIA